MEFKEYCEKTSASIAEHSKRVQDHERLVRSQAQPREETHQQPSDCYTGPIEDARPGHILHWSRLQEYRDYMRITHGIQNAKLWGVFENWVDSGQRPFKLTTKPIEVNPFDPPSPEQK
jgi:hypothetical protein